jgi:hypothetical protein
VSLARLEHDFWQRVEKAARLVIHDYRSALPHTARDQPIVTDSLIDSVAAHVARFGELSDAPRKPRFIGISCRSVHFSAPGLAICVEQ